MIEALTPLALAHLAAPDDPGRLAALAAWLSALDPADLPLAQARRACAGRPWRGLDLWSDPRGRFELSLFVIAPGRAIPIHDHPGMTVLTRVVSGRLRVETWDHPGADRREHELGPADPPQVTCPERANLHALTPLGTEGCGFIDLLLPPYGPGRRCSYYEPRPPGADGRQPLRRQG